MKKAISVTLLALWLIVGFAAPAVFSAEQAGQTKDMEATHGKSQSSQGTYRALAGKKQ
ncbi:MAG: hypothetical protein JRF43_06780 [Deltaproteobacteria bacterium]|nr:hypothetical protein [Deltaproteobacteria bacterium]